MCEAHPEVPDDAHPFANTSHCNQYSKDFTKMELQNTPGIGMKQEDDLIRNHTVVKVVKDCDFDLHSDRYECKEVQHDGKTYRMAFLACVYKCN